jgi:hypothetical protein
MWNFRFPALPPGTVKVLVALVAGEAEFTVAQLLETVMAGTTPPPTAIAAPVKKAALR